MKQVLLPLADGCEEMEAVIVADVLRRAGWHVVIAGLNGLNPVTASRGVRLLPDEPWEKLDLRSFDALVLPGGLDGTQALCRHDGVQETIRIFDIEEKMIAAICAAPLALHEAGVLEKRAFTCYPGVEEKMNRRDRSNEPVVRDGHILTSQGPGTAFEFALALIAILESPEKAETVRGGLLLQ